jgi:DNA repair exonuclease SbcCD ATPase subunit
VPTEDFRALSQIIIIILEAGQRFSQLSGTPPNDPVGAVRHVLRAYEELTNAKSKKLSRFSGGKSKGSKEPEDWERKFKAYEQKLQTCDQKLQESEHKLQASEHKLKASEQKLKASEQKLKVNEKEVSNLTIQRNALRENEIRLERVKEQLKKDLRDRTQGLKAEHAKEVAKWKGKAEKTKAELDESTRQHNYITYQHQESHQREIIRIRGEHKVVLSRAAEAARFESAATDQKHRDALQEKDNTLTIERNERSRRLQLQKDEYDKTLSERQQRYDKQLLEQQQRHDKEKHEQQHRHETGLFEQQQRHATEISALCQQLEDKIKSFEQDRIQMRSDFDARTEHLQRNNESLTGALLRRDHFKGLADSVLRAKFSSLSIKLETISFKADWDTNRESNWPFRGALLHQLCPTDTNKPNVRKLKQRIMHNNLWFILYFYVFSTPFRILGETGKDLDKDWFEEFGGSKCTKHTLYYQGADDWNSSLCRPNFGMASGERRVGKRAI